jgi:hypothetical protein
MEWRAGASAIAPKPGMADSARMSTTSHPVERLFPFALRARLVVVGREPLSRMRRKLGFVLIVEGLRPESRAAIVADYAGIPVVEHFTSEDLERSLNVRGAKVVGFRKSTLASSILTELREFRIEPAPRAAKEPVESGAPATGNAEASAAPEAAAADADTAPAEPATKEARPPESPRSSGASPRPPRPWAKRPQPESRPALPYRGERPGFERPRPAWAGQTSTPPRGERPYAAQHRDFERPRTPGGEARPARPWRQSGFRNPGSESAGRTERSGYDRPRPWAGREADGPREARGFRPPGRDFERPTSARGDDYRASRAWEKKPFRASGPPQPRTGASGGYDRPKPWARPPFDRSRGDRPYPSARRDFDGPRPRREDERGPARPWSKQPFHPPGEDRGQRVEGDRPKPWTRRPFDRPRDDRPYPPVRRDFNGPRPRRDDERGAARPWSEQPFRRQGEERGQAAARGGYDRPRVWGKQPTEGPRGERTYPPGRRDFNRPYPPRGSADRPPRPWGGKAFRRAYSTDG